MADRLANDLGIAKLTILIFFGNRTMKKAIMLDSTHHFKTSIVSAFLVLVGFMSEALISTQAKADQSPSVSTVPRPAECKWGSGFFMLTPSTTIDCDAKTTALAELLSQMLEPATGFKLKVNQAYGETNTISLALTDSLDRVGDEGYNLTVTSDTITVRARKLAGLFYGLQTLRQLLPPEIFSHEAVAGTRWIVPVVTIKDYPRFRWRGLMLDCSRHFFDKRFVERFIDVMAIHKMNSFHWHLTDDQGWRIQILKYPKLTAVGGFRKATTRSSPDSKVSAQGHDPAYGGFYTQEDIREVVQYAADRFVTVVPEIEMPGHSAAAIAAYPELGNTGQQIQVWTQWGVNPNTLNPRDSTIKFYQDVLDEILPLFPSQYIHLGGDEAPIEQWDKNPVAQELIKRQGVKDSHGVQAYMLQQMSSYLQLHHRRVVGWDEIVDDHLPDDAVVMSWRGIKGGVAAIKLGHDVVMTPDPITYFNHAEVRDNQNALGKDVGNPTLQKVYQFDPVPPGFTTDQMQHLLGAQGQMWTEFALTPDDVESHVYPRACALAEGVWTPVADKNYSDFQSRLVDHLKRLDQLHLNYNKINAPSEPH